MKPLTLDELTSPDEFALHSDDHYERLASYLDRCRRVRVGPAVTAVFENRQTLWFRAQELARVARLTDRGRVEPELNWYNRLLPVRHRLRAALWVGQQGRRPGRELDPIRRAVTAARIGFRSDAGDEVPGSLLADRVGDRLIGLMQWVEFQFDDGYRAAFADPTREWRLFVDSPAYSHASPALGGDVRDSLLADLDESDRE